MFVCLYDIRLLCCKHVAEWLRRRTRDLEVWGSIPVAPVMCRSLGQALNPHRLWSPSSNGYLVEREKNVVNGIKPSPLYAAWLHSPQGDETVYVCIP